MDKISAQYVIKSIKDTFSNVHAILIQEDNKYYVQVYETSKDITDKTLFCTFHTMFEYDYFLHMLKVFHL